jgi:hypothetical protein
VSTWLLVHPPLLGPAVLRPLAAHLRAEGHAVAVPDLRPAVDTAPGWPERWTTLAAGGGTADVVVGFSGAGVVLPAVAAAVGARRVVWVDAIVPARSGATTPSDDMRALVAPLVRDGRIADWTSWWGPDALPELIPEPGLRSAVQAEGHQLPADFYDIPVPVPGSWPEDGARYVWLSPAYDGDAAEAADRGWPVVGGGDGAHLDVATDPARVVRLLD